MAMSLTHMQAQALDFIARFQTENNGVSPSCEEMKQELGLASKSGVHRLLMALQERGRIHRPANRARAIEILAEPPPRPALEAFTSRELIVELARRGETNRQAA